MHYFATLSVGGTYIFKDKQFFLGEELSVSEEEATYLAKLNDPRLIEQGNGMAVIRVPIFKIRSEAKTTQEKVLEKIETAPDTLKPTRK